MNFALKHLHIMPSEFWKLTFAEWRPLYESIVGKQDQPMSKKDSASLIDRYKAQFKAAEDGKS